MSTGGLPVGGDARTLFQGFTDTVRRHPDAPALRVAGHELDYAELLDRVERLATRLAGPHGRPPRVVGLCASRSLAAYVGYLAALRLAATVVPLSPDAPAERIRRTCAHAGVDALLADDAGRRVADEAAGPVGVLHLPDTPDDRWYDVPAERWTGAYTGGPAGVTAVADLRVDLRPVGVRHVRRLAVGGAAGGPRNDAGGTSLRRPRPATCPASCRCAEPDGYERADPCRGRGDDGGVSAVRLIAAARPGV
ncbi:AMP-binding protein [Micromonospora sp. NPDC048170]|uniref:AMP-binding protein n=1 Tax=Micromonospora sp. NPDC048170 TaxID=3154819 RepID=UPI0033C89F2D